MARSNDAPYKSEPRITEALREDVMACASMLQNHPAKFTQALCDPTTRKEMRQLVRDLFELCQIIRDDA